MVAIVARKALMVHFPIVYALVLLVMAAFLAGSFSIGTDLIRKSHTKTVMSDVQRFQAAFRQFQLTYRALPGDMNNASSYWKDCRFDIADCNGDGDDKITSVSHDRTTEAILAWQHLSLAGFTEVPSSGNLIGGYHIPGENIPTAPYEQSGYLISDSIAYHHASWNGTHHLKIGGLSDWRFEEAIVTLPDAIAMDQKADDGIASSGLILAHSDEKNGCLDNYNREILVGKQTAHYATDLSSDAKCSVYYQID